MDKFLKICFLVVFLFIDILMFEIVNMDSNVSIGGVISDMLVSNMVLLL